MYLYLFFLLFSSGASSYFRPLKEMPHLQNKTTITIIDEMICLLKAEKEPINMQFSKPLHVQDQSCAHYNTKKFISELERIHTCSCMKIVEKDMKKLEKQCPFLKNSSNTKANCSQEAKTNFSLFKESLEEFLMWVNGKQDSCCNIMKSELDSYLDGKCICPDPWKYRRGRF